MGAKVTEGLASSNIC